MTNSRRKPLTRVELALMGAQRAWKAPADAAARAACSDCDDTGIVLEHAADCGACFNTLGECCSYSEKYCACVSGRALKEREE